MNPNESASLGILLFAHGSRDARWRAPVERIAARVRERRPGTRVRCSYLEIIEPDLPAAARELIAEGVTRLRVLPLFLGVGKHVREDLPALVENLRRDHPQITVELLGAVGETDALVELLACMALADSPDTNSSAISGDTTRRA